MIAGGNVLIVGKIGKVGRESKRRNYIAGNSENLSEFNKAIVAEID